MQPSWVVYAMSDADAQQYVVKLLRRIEGLIVQTHKNETDHFVIVECKDDLQRRRIHEFVMIVDLGAYLVQTIHGLHGHAPAPSTKDRADVSYA